MAVQEGNGWGAEIDFGRTTDAWPAQILDLTTYMVNAAWINPTGRVRPFGVRRRRHHAGRRLRLAMQRPGDGPMTSD